MTIENKIKQMLKNFTFFFQTEKLSDIKIEQLKNKISTVQIKFCFLNNSFDE